MSMLAFARRQLLDSALLFPQFRVSSAGGRAAAVVVGVLLLTFASRCSVPLPVGPVPLTMQTLAVSLCGAVLGWRLGASTVFMWLVVGFAGFPVFANGGGSLYFLGPTGGYLFSFPLMSAFVGWLVCYRGLDERAFGKLGIFIAFLAAFLAGEALCLSLGTFYLAFHLGGEKAIIHGMLPFLVGSVMKSCIGSLFLIGLERVGPSSFRGAEGDR